MIRRLVDVLLAGTALVICFPLFVMAAIGIACSSRGPIFYRARRVGVNGVPFTMYKFRSMHVNADLEQSRITAGRDPRIFPFGGLLRKTKIDELPQLLNIIRGDMAIIGPRAEDPEIVERYYTEAEWETLDVKPGLSSPGSLYYFVNSEEQIDGEDAETSYARDALPIKLALDRIYIRQASLLYDFWVMWRTLLVIVLVLFGVRNFPLPPEMIEALRLLRERVGVEER